MQNIPLDNLVHLQQQRTNSAAFVIASSKSTFVHIAKTDGLLDSDIQFYASPTPFCGVSADQYNPYFIMAILSVTPLSDKIEMLNQIQLPEVLFDTHPDIRRSMTLNAMRMSTELFSDGSERVYQLALQRLEANQPDVVHDLLVYLMHVILDARREYAEETALRAESIAAYLGIDSQKVLLFVREYGNDKFALTKCLEQGKAGKLRRELNVAALLTNQLELLKPHQQSADNKEAQVLEMIRRVLDLWKVS